MPPANDPRMAAAMDVVEADIPESLKQLVSEKEFADKAKELLMSAGGQAAMNQTPPKSPTVAEGVEKQAEEGVAGLLARLSPGIRQRGQQMAMAQRSAPMQGQRPPMSQQGVSGMPARNMMKAAQGGVVGFNQGLMVRSQERARAREESSAEETSRAAAIAAKNNRYVALINEGVPAKEAKAIVEAEALAASAEEIPFEMRPNSARDVGNIANIGGIAGLLAKAGQKEPPFRVQGMEEATPKITEYDPTRTETTDLPFGTAQDTFVPRVGGIMPAAAREKNEFEKQVEKELIAGMSTNVEKGATTRGDRAKELMGLEGLMAERKALQGEARGLREERFSPERMKKRTLRAGLAGLGAKGLGGFGSGYTSEQDLIDSERAAAAGVSLAEMDSLITELRAMGMTRFEAENAARAELSARKTAAVDAGATRVNTQETNRNAMTRAEMQAATQRDVANIQGVTSRAVAAAQASNSEFGRSLGIKIQELRLNEPNLTEQERESRALQSLFDQDVRVQLSKLGVTQADQQRKEITDSISSAIKILEGDISLMADPVKRQTRIMEVAEEIQRSYGSEGNTLPIITSQAAFDALAPGAYFTENGVTMQKPLP